MLVTRTEMFTDWSYEGVHPGEQAATVGIGLASGHIYYRYSHDFLKSGESIQRERSFVELSDGTTYELGSGASAEKININYHGLTGSGEIYIEVSGSKFGVGVSRILRHVTIEYDDGKVPVLDTDQLKGILAELSDNLTDSMVTTAESVKGELRSELQTKLIDVKVDLQNQCNETVQNSAEAIRAEIDEAVQGVQEDLSDWSDTTGETLDRMNSMIASQEKRSDSRIYIAQIPLAGKFTSIAQNRQLNLLTNQTTSGILYGDDIFTLTGSGEDALIRVADGVDMSNNRVLSVNVLLDSLEVSDPTNNAGFCFMQLRDSTNAIQSQTAFFFNREHGWPKVNPFIQTQVSVFIPKGLDAGTLLSGGFKVTLVHYSKGTINISGGKIDLSMIRS